MFIWNIIEPPHPISSANSLCAYSLSEPLSMLLSVQVILRSPSSTLNHVQDQTAGVEEGRQGQDKHEGIVKIFF